MLFYSKVFNFKQSNYCCLVNVTEKLKFIFERMETIVAKGKGTGYHHLLLYLLFFFLMCVNPLPIHIILDMTKLKAFTDDKLKVC